jgi:glycosyltransferase involved in cell wall biosynthesis
MPPSADPIRIGFGNFCSDDWIAGCHYLSNLFIALSVVETDRPAISVINTSVAQADHFAARVDHPWYQPLIFAPRRDLSQRLRARLGRPANDYADFLRAAGVDVLFTKSMGRREVAAGVPVLAWIPDFQHLHMPELFPPDEIASRNHHFKLVTDNASRIILSSHAALADLASFAPGAEARARILHFVAHVHPSIYDRDPAWVADHYHLPPRFVYLPNQFWIHKNHAVVVDALAIARQTDPSITVVCTGSTHEHRDPAYFPKLLARVSELGIRDNFIVLGTIPYAHVPSLIRQSLAVLQPSKFEGWSTIVEECKSTGKGMILSALPVHHEQDPPNTRYFPPDDPQALAQHLIDVFASTAPGPDAGLEAQARATLMERMGQVGSTLMDIVREVL